MTERPSGYALIAHTTAPDEAPVAPGTSIRGRGARSNLTGRYETFQREAFDDGWGVDGDEVSALRTTVLKDASRSIIATNQSPDISFDQSINPYRGCEHGCIYCYARPSHAYWGYSPGLDFESVIFTKPDGAKLLEQFFNRPGYNPKPIVIGANTDAWQPVERRLEITRDILKVFARYKHPVSFITKSALVLRDLDILGPMAEQGLAKGAISLTTLDRKLARDMEPRAAAPHRRLKAIEGLASAGLPVTVMMAPIIPASDDTVACHIMLAGDIAPEVFIITTQALDDFWMLRSHVLCLSGIGRHIIEFFTINETPLIRHHRAFTPLFWIHDTLRFHYETAVFPCISIAVN